MRDVVDESLSRRVREPAFNAPWPVLTLITALVAAHAVRVFTGSGIEGLALNDQSLNHGEVAPLVTYLFLHGSWAHVLMNSVFVLAFGAPVARFFGLGLRGAAAFLGLFLICGIIAALGYAGWLRAITALHPAPAGWALVGASGAAAGLMGAAARLMEGRGRLGSIGGRRVIGMTLTWIAANALLGLSGLTPGAAGLPVAWEAHIFGYFAGLLLAGPLGLVAGVSRDQTFAP